LPASRLAAGESALVAMWSFYLNWSRKIFPHPSGYSA
jgi:hypothetical protein